MSEIDDEMLPGARVESDANGLRTWYWPGGDIQFENSKWYVASKRWLVAEYGEWRFKRRPVALPKKYHRMWRCDKCYRVWYGHWSYDDVHCMGHGSTIESPHAMMPAAQLQSLLLANPDNYDRATWDQLQHSESRCSGTPYQWPDKAAVAIIRLTDSWKDVQLYSLAQGLERENQGDSLQRPDGKLSARKATRNRARAGDRPKWERQIDTDGVHIIRLMGKEP